MNSSILAWYKSHSLKDSKRTYSNLICIEIIYIVWVRYLVHYEQLLASAVILNRLMTRTGFLGIGGKREQEREEGIR